MLVILIRISELSEVGDNPMVGIGVGCIAGNVREMMEAANEMIPIAVAVIINIRTI